MKISIELEPEDVKLILSTIAQTPKMIMVRRARALCDLLEDKMTEIMPNEKKD